MKEYDVIVVGTGSGMVIVEEAVDHGLKVALIDKGERLGGTCMNYGCIPSKMLIHPADRIMEIRKARELGINITIDSIDFKAIMTRMRESRENTGEEVTQGLRNMEGVDFYEGEASFTGDYTLEVNGESLKGEKIFLATGSRPVVPPIKGLDTVAYLTNETVLDLTEKPESLIIIGGGYIGVEYAHFFEAMGTGVTIIEMADRLVMSEEPEIADELLKQLRQRMTLKLGSKVIEIRNDNGKATVVTEDSDGNQTETTAGALMLAIGRRSNADLLKVENSGIELNERGFIRVNEFWETTKKNIYAVGDANGLSMFTHAANRQAALCIYNVLEGTEMTLDPIDVPHAVYSYPQIGSIGLRESQAAEKYRIRTKITKYYEIAKGEAMMERDGFAKAIFDEESDHLLGFHIIGPYAPILVQEVVNAMTAGGQTEEINDAIHIHPSLTELIALAIY